MKPKVLIVGTDEEGAPEWLDEFRDSLDADFIEDKPNATHIVYIFTPENFGIESAVNVVDDSKDRAKKMIVCIHDPDATLSETDTNLLYHVCQKVHDNGAIWMPSLEEVAMYVNLSTDPKKKIKLKKESDAKRKKDERQHEEYHEEAMRELEVLMGGYKAEIELLNLDIYDLKAEIETLKNPKKETVEE